MLATKVTTLPMQRNVLVKITMYSDFCRVGWNATYHSKRTIQAFVMGIRMPTKAALFSSLVSTECHGVHDEVTDSRNWASMTLLLALSQLPFNLWAAPPSSSDL